jgi:hypothetical protein
MLLAEAADISENLRELYRKSLTDRENRAKYFQRSLSIIEQALRDAGSELEELIDIYYPQHSRFQRQFTTPRWLRDDACSKLSISPLVWDEALAGKPIVPLLALESPEYGGEGLTVKQALMLMGRIQDLGFFAIANKMNEKEAMLFWSRATDEMPFMPIDRFLQLISYLTDKGAQSLTAIRRMLETMAPAEIIAKMLKGDIVDMEIRTMQPGQAFKGPLYRAWGKTVTPATVYVETIDKPRRYLHITEFPKGTFKGVLYSRDRQVIAKVPEQMLPYTGAQAILEVESEHNSIKCVTDIYSLEDDWDIHKLPYLDRIAYLNRMQFKVPVKTGKLLEAESDLGHLIETAETHQRLRLTLPGPFEIGGEGGWMILKDAFHMHLLVNAIKKDDEFNTQVRISAMDGYEMYEVGELEVPLGPAQHIRQRLAKAGMLAGLNWLPVDEYAVVVAVEVTEFTLDTLVLKGAKLAYVDDNMGYGDVSQLTDLIELVA